MNSNILATTVLVLVVAAFFLVWFQSELSLRVTGGLLQVVGVITTTKAVQWRFKKASGGSIAKMKVTEADNKVTFAERDELQEKFDLLDKTLRTLSERIESEARTREAWTREVLAQLKTPWARVGMYWIVAGIIIVIIADACTPV